MGHWMAQMAQSVPTHKVQAWLDSVAQYWGKYSPSSTGETDDFCGLLARSQASTALSDAHSRYSVSAGDISHLHWGLHSTPGLLLGVYIFNCTWLLCDSLFLYPFPSMVTLSPNCYYHVMMWKWYNVLVLKCIIIIIVRQLCFSI